MSKTIEKSLSPSPFIDMANVLHERWINWVLTSQVPIAPVNATHNLNTKELGLRLMHGAITRLACTKDAQSQLHLLLRLVTVLDASHAAYPLDSSNGNLLVVWVHGLFESAVCDVDMAVQTAIHDVTRWLLTQGKFDPREWDNKNNRSCIEYVKRILKSSQYINPRIDRILRTRMFWQTLVYLSTSCWDEICMDICSLMRSFTRCAREQVWWFFDECAPHMCSSKATSMLRSTYNFRLDSDLESRIRLTAYAVQHGAVLPNPHIPHSTLHLLVAAVQDPILSTDILRLPASIFVRLAPLAATWPARAWEYESLVDGRALIAREQSPSDEIAYACGLHLWQTWRKHGHSALSSSHLIPDLASLVFEFLNP
jgi:hypothetical protein